MSANPTPNDATQANGNTAPAVTPASPASAGLTSVGVTLGAALASAMSANPTPNDATQANANTATSATPASTTSASVTPTSAPAAANATKPNGSATAAARGKKPSSGSSSQASHTFAATRSVARKLALQALYRWQLNDAPWQDLIQEFGEAEDMRNADREYFRELVEGVHGSRQALDTRLAELMDRPPEQLDPVEHAILLIGLYELTSRPEVPYRVSINEAVGLTKRFGATDGHKFVNAVLDRAARALRPHEN
jgi:transcription antitermination protein NusB